MILSDLIHSQTNAAAISRSMMDLNDDVIANLNSTLTAAITTIRATATDNTNNNNNNKTDDDSNICELCGWMAAACSALAFGTFAVPIKSHIARTLNIDPFIMQSYKTFMVLITSILYVVLCMKQSIFNTPFTPWGIVSGLFWVPSGIATIYAVKTIGLALGIGIASSLIVLVSFIWGIFIFHEPIHSQVGACIAIICMMIGLFGMSYYSVPVVSASSTTNTSVTTAIDGTTMPTIYEEVGTNIDDDDDDDDENLDNNNADFDDHQLQRQPYKDVTETDLEISRVTHRTHTHFDTNNNCDDNDHHHDRHTIINDPVYGDTDMSSRSSDNNNNNDPDASSSRVPQNGIHYEHELVQHVYMFGHKVSKRHLGMLSAAFCGLYGGSIMAPMKFANTNIKGTHYLFSFAIGASIVNVVLWIFRYCYNVYYYHSCYEAYYHLPSFYIRQMWLVGGTCGLIWSIGNYFSLLSVYFLGEGVGYPLVQTSILISGLWGLFYFKEIHGTERITKWLISSLMTVFGILFLSYEHHTK